MDNDLTLEELLAAIADGVVTASMYGTNPIIYNLIELEGRPVFLAGWELSANEVSDAADLTINEDDLARYIASDIHGAYIIRKHYAVSRVTSIPFAGPSNLTIESVPEDGILAKRLIAALEMREELQYHNRRIAA